MVNIRQIQTVQLQDAKYIEDLITAAWGGGCEFAVPRYLTVTLARENGGVVLIAWDGKKPIGFCLGFLSFTGDEERVSNRTKLKHCSHMAAILPEYRGRQWGQKIKWAQRDAVLKMGIDLITWTFDPLETLNGRLNIHKLGAICTQYKRNIYGEGRDALNWGSPTDRFYVKWHIASAWVKAHEAETYQSRTVDEWTAVGVPIANTTFTTDGVRRAGDIDETAVDAKQLLIAVPRDYLAVKKASIEWGLEWRVHTGSLFERAFEEGFTAVDLIIKNDLCYYLLEKNFDENRTN